MKIIHEEILIDAGDVTHSQEWQGIREEVYQAIAAVSWPPGSDQFIIRPDSHLNGVKPIKEACMLMLRDQFVWQLEASVFIQDAHRPGRVDALKQTAKGGFVFEWETGNISSSHRALNKISLGLLRGLIWGGVLVLPTRRLYPYLTDRVGNYEELLPYFPVWRSIPIDYGVLSVVAVEHDAIDPSVPPIGKGTDGRALV